MSPSLHVVCDWSAEVLEHAVALLESVAGPVQVGTSTEGRATECRAVASQLELMGKMNAHFREQQEALGFMLDRMAELTLDFQWERDSLFDGMAAAAQSPKREVVAA